MCTDALPSPRPQVPGANPQCRSVTDPFATALIVRVACRLAGRPEFSLSDEADIAQELRTKLWSSEVSFDPEVGTWEAFVTTVVRRRAGSLLRAQRAKKRHHRRITSLCVHVQAEGDEPIELVHTIGQRELDNRRHSYPGSDQEQTELRMDVELRIAKLSATERDLVERLKYGSIGAVARDLGIARSTLRYRAKQLQQHFE